MSIFRTVTARFAPGPVMTALVALLVPALVGLGLWQLDRAAEKRGHEERYLERLGMAPAVPPASLEEAGFLRVRLQGRYRPGEHYLVDNRVREGRVGYWVVSRFQADDGRTFLVNRGWTAAPAVRERLPEVPSPQGQVRLVGIVWPDTGLPPLLAPDPWPETWPKRVQRLNVARMAREGEAVAPAEIRLEAGQPGVLEPVPADMGFHDERHRGYAVQWLALAATLGAAYLVYGFHRPREPS